VSAELDFAGDWAGEEEFRLAGQNACLVNMIQDNIGPFPRKRTDG